MKIYTAYANIPSSINITASSSEEAHELAIQYIQHIFANLQVTVVSQVPCELVSLNCPYKEGFCMGCEERELDLPSGLVGKEIANYIKENF